MADVQTNTPETSLGDELQRIEDEFRRDVASLVSNELAVDDTHPSMPLLTGMFSSPEPRHEDAGVYLFGEQHVLRYVGLPKDANRARTNMVSMALSALNQVPNFRFGIKKAFHSKTMPSLNKVTRVVPEVSPEFSFNLSELKLNRVLKLELSKQKHAPHQAPPPLYPISGVFRRNELQDELATKRFEASGDALEPAEQSDSDRVYDKGALAGLRRGMRKRACVSLGLTSVDLRSSQVAILAAQGNLDAVRDTLKLAMENHTSYIDEMNLKVPNDLAKQAMLAMTFGQDPINAVTEMCLESGRTLNVEDVVDMFQRNEVREVTEYINGETERLMREEGHTRKQARHHVACRIQNIEFRFVARTLLKWLNEHSKARLVLWLHDGFSLDLSAYGDQRHELEQDLIATFQHGLDAQGWLTYLRLED